MKTAFGHPRALARVGEAEPQSLEPARHSPEFRDSASSGTYFRAVRPTPQQMAALTRGTTPHARQLTRLRALIEAGLWRPDALAVASAVVRDGAWLGDAEVADPPRSSR